MKAKINVLFEVVINVDGKCKTSVSFELPDHPEIPCPEEIKKLVIGQIGMLCGVMNAAGDHIFTESFGQTNGEKP